MSSICADTFLLLSQIKPEQLQKIKDIKVELDFDANLCFFKDNQGNKPSPSHPANSVLKYGKFIEHNSQPIFEGREYSQINCFSQSKEVKDLLGKRKLSLTHTDSLFPAVKKLQDLKNIEIYGQFQGDDTTWLTSDERVDKHQFEKLKEEVEKTFDSLTRSDMVYPDTSKWKKAPTPESLEALLDKFYESHQDELNGFTIEWNLEQQAPFFTVKTFKSQEEHEKVIDLLDDFCQKTNTLEATSENSGSTDASQTHDSQSNSPPVEEEEVDDEEEEEEEVIPAFIPKEKVEEVELKWYEQPYDGQFPVSGWIMIGSQWLRDQFLKKALYIQEKYGGRICVNGKKILMVSEFIEELADMKVECKQLITKISEESRMRVDSQNNESHSSNKTPRNPPASQPSKTVEKCFENYNFDKWQKILADSKEPILRKVEVEKLSAKAEESKSEPGYAWVREDGTEFSFSKFHSNQIKEAVDAGKAVVNLKTPLIIEKGDTGAIYQFNFSESKFICTADGNETLDFQIIKNRLYTPPKTENGLPIKFKPELSGPILKEHEKGTKIVKLFYGNWSVNLKNHQITYESEDQKKEFKLKKAETVQVNASPLCNLRIKAEESEIEKLSQLLA